MLGGRNAGAEGKVGVAGRGGAGWGVPQQESGPGLWCTALAQDSQESSKCGCGLLSSHVKPLSTDTEQERGLRQRMEQGC